MNNNWSVRIRDAAKELVQAANKDASSTHTELLSDVRLIFNARGFDRIPSKDLVAELIALEDRPWAEWKGGKAFSTHQLASILRSFGISSSSIRIEGGRTPKGYKREQFNDAWARYLPSTLDTSSCCGSSATPDDCGVSDTPEYAHETAGCGDVALNNEVGGVMYDDDEIPF